MARVGGGGGEKTADNGALPLSNLTCATGRAGRAVASGVLIGCSLRRDAIAMQAVGKRDLSGCIKGTLEE